MENKEKFKQLFGLPRDGFLEPVDLLDTEVGFSVYKEREEEGFKSLFRFYVKDDDFKNADILKPITITASYGKENEDGITVSSSEFKRKLNGPIDFISENDFFYNIKDNKIYKKDKKSQISGIDLLKKQDSLHMKTTRLSGIPLVFKLFLFHSVITKFWEIIFILIATFQYLISGQKIKIFDRLTDSSKYSNTPTYKTLEIKESELINLWGYKVKPWIAVIYSFLHIIVYIIFYDYSFKPSWLVALFKNNFLTLMYGIISLGLANTFLPILFSPIKLKSILKLIQSAHWNAAVKKVKI